MQPPFTKSFSQKNIYLYTLILFSVSNSLVYSNLFVEKICTAKSLMFSSTMLLFLSIAIIVNLTRSKRELTFYYNLPSLLFTSFCLYVFIISCFLEIPVTANRDLHELIALFILYQLVVRFINVKEDNLAVIVKVIIVIGLVQALWALLQWTGTTENLLSNFDLAGGLGNPNVLSTFLSSTLYLPYTLFFLKLAQIHQKEKDVSGFFCPDYF